MPGRLHGKNCLKAKLTRRLLAGQLLMLLAVTLGFLGHELARGGAAPEKFSASLLFGSLLLLGAAGGTAGHSWLFSRRVERVISDPIAHLAQKMAIVSRSQDYQVRVQSWSDDELGLLFDCFNDMLAEIATRDERLALHSEELELEVADRTRELSSVNRQLAESLDEVRRAMQAAQAASQAKSEFLAQMSHEIRTPMFGVLGMTELLQNTKLNKKQSRYVEKVRHSGQALLAIINDILDFSKIEAGKMELEAIPFDLHELVAETVDLFYRDAEKKELELSFRIAPEVPPSFLGDPGRLRQVLVNLLGNALKFTHSGTVSLDLTMERPPNLVRISISDTGIGITPEVRARIFNKFSQGDHSMTRRYGGTGLGLAIVKQLTELMGGELSLVSEPGRGSTFAFTASLGPLSEHEWLWPERCCTALLHGKRVLIASEEAATGTSMQNLLTGWGMEVIWVTDAPGALSRLVATPFDLAILDQQLAGTDGLELAATIRSLPSGRSLRLMLLADADFEEQNVLAQQTGAFLFFKTSLRQHGLYWALLRTLGMGHATAEDASRGRLGRSPRVLLVEDNPVNQEVGCGMLESLGCQVELVDNGLSALQAVESTDYDLLFMDCEMPVMDGLEATRRIRSREESQRSASCRRLPIIALTAYAMKGDRQACLAAGADDYLSKPFTREELSRLIGRHLGAALSEALPYRAETVAPEATGTEEVISLDKMSGALEMIRQLPGNRGMEVLRKVIDLYLASTPALLQTMREAESGGDAEKLKCAAHSFKSSSANLGALKLAGVCSQLEMLGRAGSTRGALTLLNKVEEEYRLVRDALQGDSLC